MKRFLFLLIGITLIGSFSGCSSTKTQVNYTTQEYSKTPETQLILDQSSQNTKKEKTLAKEKLPNAKIFDTGLKLQGENATQIIYFNNFYNNDIDELISQWYVKGVGVQVEQPPALESLLLSSATQDNYKGAFLNAERFKSQTEVNQILESHQQDIEQNHLMLEKNGTSYMVKGVEDKNLDLTGSAEEHPAWKKVEASPNLIFFGYIAGNGYGYSLSSFYSLIKEAEHYFTEFSKDDQKKAEEFMKHFEYPFFSDKANDNTIQINHEDGAYVFVLQREIDSENQSTKYKLNLSQAFLALKQLQAKGLLKNLTMEVKNDWLRLSYKIDEKDMYQIVGQ